MKNEWRYSLIRKLLFFTVPAVVLTILAIQLGLAFVLLSIPVIALGIAMPLTEIFSHFCPNLFYPARWRKHPKPTLSIARSLKKAEKYDQALNELRRLTQTDSQEVDIWLEMIEIAMIDMKDKNLGEQVFREAYSILEKEDKRSVVKRFYSNIS